MKKRNTILVIIAISLLILAFQNTKTLKEVKIGTQTWSSENLNVATFKNGDSIPVVKSMFEWANAFYSKKPACCYHSNKLENESRGRLYNWYAVTDPRGLAPESWRIPSDGDWEILVNFVGGKDSAALKLKSIDGWEKNKKKTGNGNNEGGFNALPSGYRTQNGAFGPIKLYSGWWTSTPNTSDGAQMVRFTYDKTDATSVQQYKAFGLAVRCVK